MKTDSNQLRAGNFCKTKEVALNKKVFMSTFLVRFFIAVALLMIISLKSNYIYSQTIDEWKQEIDFNFVEVKIDSILNSTVGAESPGIAIAIVKDDKIVISKTRGLAELENSISITNETTFNPGSVARQFTAFAISILENEGKLALMEVTS